MASGTRYVLDGYEPPGACAFDRGQVYPQLLRFTPGGVCGPRLLRSVFLSDLSGLVGDLTCGVLGLLGRSSSRFLSLSRYLSSLIRGLPRNILGLSRCLSRRVLHALHGLPYLVGHPAQRTSASLLFTFLLASPGQPTGESANGVLNLSGRLTGLVGDLARGVLDLSGCLASGIRRLSCDLSGLIRSLSGGILSLTCCLARCVLCLLGRLPRELLHLLQGLLGSLVHRVLDACILGRLIHGAFELRVGVDHLLDLGLLVALGELLGVLLQLLAVVLGLALDLTQRLPVEVLGVLHGLLLHLLLKIRSLVCHFVSLRFIDFRFR